MRKFMIVGNWKENLNVHESSLHLHRLSQKIKTHRDIEVVLAPTLLALQPLSLEIDRRKFKLAAQNAYFEDEGAYTGEVSFAMLRNIADYSIVGHSERRLYFDETLEIVRDKVKAAVRNGITPILCVGETKKERDEGETKQVLNDKVTTAISELTSSEIENIVIAYEPIWAIGTGVTAKPDDVDEAIKFIRRDIGELYGQKASENTRVLYGAGVEPHEVSSILSLNSGVDGLLVGGASLSIERFTDIIDAAYSLQTKAE